jgi:hypothetical protein
MQQVQQELVEQVRVVAARHSFVQVLQASSRALLGASAQGVAAGGHRHTIACGWLKTGVKGFTKKTVILQSSGGQ